MAEIIREVVLDPGIQMDAWTEAYLYAAARADHVRATILPRLEAGENVLCERYLDSSLAYQGFGRGLGVEAVRALNAYAVGTVVPDRTFYLRLDQDERERRARELGMPPDRIEAVGAGFMRRVEEGFEELARLEPRGSKSSTLRSRRRISPDEWWVGCATCNILVRLMADRRDRFEGVLGNETALRLLGRALETGEVSQAYLFHGPPGVGKRMVALRFGAALVAGGDGGGRQGAQGTAS